MKESRDFKIVKLLNEYEIVINGGRKHDIKVGDRFQILDSEGSEVKDPETGEILGRLERIKDIVIVKEVYDKMSVCSSQIITRKSPFNTIVGEPNFLKDTTIQQRLKVDLTQITETEGKSDEVIHIGDTVRNVFSEE